MALSEVPTTARRRWAAALASAAALGGALLASPAAAAPLPAYEAYVWASDVNLRPCPQLSDACRPTGVRLGREYVSAYCQALGDRVVDGTYANAYWVEVAAHGQVGWISAVYVRGGDNDRPAPGIPGPDSCV
ncbi:hypothetical protein [Streptomyces sp. NRRL WC-3742]|uniref:hypothetical protein n=1 Tax=Streptomyces sp. NRRL WC-3742 TaxID=1463934 RepID=UPI0006902979|nr:hypothetical protein [Streptomyces sp. NRRL WC-3742]